MQLGHGFGELTSNRSVFLPRLDQLGSVGLRVPPTDVFHKDELGLP